MEIQVNMVLWALILLSVAQKISYKFLELPLAKVSVHCGGH